MKVSPSYLKKSLGLLQKINPRLAVQMQNVNPTELEWCETEQKELNLKRTYQDQTYYYHSPLSAEQEAHTWFASLQTQEITTLFVYGVGLGYYYEAAKSWLKSHSQHALIFLEEDSSVIYRLYETEVGYQILKDPQVQLIYLQDSKENKTALNDLTWLYVNQPFSISSLKLYEEVNLQGYADLQHQLASGLVEKKIFADEYLQYGVPFFRNFYSNLFELPHAYLGNALFDRLEGVPAIICGAGPSLNKNVGLLNALKEHALLFTGGSALNALIPKGIKPHFGVAIDPNATQYPRVAVTKGTNIPFFYRNRLFHDALKSISGSRLYLTGAGGYETAEWFEKELGITGKNLDEGHNVVNFCLEIAVALGCNPIILVGVDLALTHDQHYADGVVQNLHLTEKDFETGENFENRPVRKEDIYGKPVYTYWKWIAESEWIAEFARLHPHVNFINATEGGLGFKDILNLSLQEVTSQFLKQKQPKIELLDAEMQRHPLSVIRNQQIVEALTTFQASLDRCIELFAKLKEEYEKLMQQIQADKTFVPDLEAIHLSLLEADIEAEIGYVYLLHTFNQVFVRLNYRATYELQSPKRRFSEQKKAFKKLELQMQRITFLRDVARVNRELIQRSLKQASA